MRAALLFAALIWAGAAEADPGPTSAPAATTPVTPVRAAPMSLPPGARRPQSLSPAAFGAGGPPLVLYGPRLGLMIEKALPSPTVLPQRRHRVTLRLVLDAAGSVAKVEVATPSGSPAFDAAALAALGPFAPKGPRTFPLPKDEKLRTRVTTLGVEVPVRERLPMKLLAPALRHAPAPMPAPASTEPRKEP